MDRTRLRLSSALLLAHATCGGQTCAAPLPSGSGSVTESRFETLFAAALAERGPAYLTARQAVLGLGPAALPELKARRTSTDWRVALQANILTGWLTSASLFRRCVDFVDGKLPGDPGITGTFGPKKRAAAVAELVPTVTPCLLELVMKVRGIDAEQKAAAFTSLQAMRDRSAATPLISLLADDDPDIRRSAAGVLGSFDDPSAVPPLLTLLEDARQPPAVRVSAAGSLGALGASQAAPILRD